MPTKPLFILTLLVFLLPLTQVSVAQNTPKPKSISIACGAVGVEYELCKEATEAWSKESGVEVKLVSTPNDTNQKLALFQQLLSSRSSDIDVFMVDIVWPGVLHSHFEDLSSHVPEADKAAHFDNLIQNNTVQNRWVAIPWYVDTGVLYYRKDLLEKYNLKVPQTWEEMTSAAQKIQTEEQKRDSKFVGYVFQGKAYEGLSCNIMEWLASFGGTSIVQPDGKILANTPENQAALTLAASWVGSISPRGVLNYAEEEARGVFQSGGAAFMRNWPYAWQLLNAEGSPISKKVGVAPIPRGGENGKHAPVLGGWHLAVSRYSQNKKEAISLIRYITSESVQKARIKHGFFPTHKSLYADSELKKSSPLFGVLADSLSTAVARPSRSTGSQYNRVSNEIWNAGFSVLSGRATPENSLKQLERRLNRLTKDGKWN